jgi:hypothetical protein
LENAEDEWQLAATRLLHCCTPNETSKIDGAVSADKSKVNIGVRNRAHSTWAYRKRAALTMAIASL